MKSRLNNEENKINLETKRPLSKPSCKTFAGYTVLCFSTECESKPSKLVSFIDFREEEERTVPFVSMWVDFDWVQNVRRQQPETKTVNVQVTN